MGLSVDFLRRKPRMLIGVDISETIVRLLEFDRGGSDPRVGAYAWEAIPAGAIRNQQIIDAPAIADALLRALERSGCCSRNAAIAVAGTAVISKILLMPAGLDEDELEDQVRAKAKSHIPYPAEEVSLDFQILGPDPYDPHLDRVLLVACRRDEIDIRKAVLEMAHMCVKRVDVEEYALLNACQLLKRQLPDTENATRLAIFDIRDKYIRMAIRSRMENLYCQEIALGESGMVNTTTERTDEQLHDFARHAAAQINHALEFYQSAAVTGDEAIDQIVITGMSGMFPGFNSLLEQYLCRPFIAGNPATGLSARNPSLHEAIEADAPMLMVAAGLALREATCIH